jgi:uncharacterized phage infection (PIP) family protein YhgE
MLRSVALALALDVSKGNRGSNEGSELATRSQLGNHVAAVLRECSQAHVASAQKLRLEKQRCQDGTDRLRKTADDAAKTIDKLRMEINDAAGNSASLKKAAAKAEQDVVLWNRRLRAVTQAHELNKTRHDVDEAHADALYTAMLKNLSSKIETATQARNSKTATMKNMLKERAQRWDAMLTVMTTRDGGYRELRKFSADCRAKILRLSNSESSLAEDLKSMRNISRLLEDHNLREHSEPQSVLLEIQNLVTEKRKHSPNMIWLALASVIESNITLV